MHRRHTGIPVPCHVELHGNRPLPRPPPSRVPRPGRGRRWTTGGLGDLADDVGLIVAEFCSNAWTHGSPPVVVTLLLQDSVLTVEVSDAGAWPGGVRRAPPARRGRPRSPRRRRRRPADRNRRRALGAPGCGHGCTSSGYPPDRAREPRPGEHETYDALR